MKLKWKGEKQWVQNSAYPLTHHALHVPGEPGAKAFADNLLLGQGFVYSRTAPLLQSIESQLSTQGFVKSEEIYFFLLFF